MQSLTAWHLAVLSLDLKDASGESFSDTKAAIGGVIHKFRLDRNGVQIGLDEYITPRPEGFFFRKKQEVRCLDWSLEP